MKTSETCPHCSTEIKRDQAYCLTCGMSRGVLTATPKENYLRACVAALELLRQTSQRVRPLRETVQAIALIEAAIEKLREKGGNKE
jgi:hypothetical protein